MPLHPYLKSQLVHFDGITSDSDFESFRAATERFEQDPVSWGGPEVDVVSDTIPGPNGPVEIRIYNSGARESGVITWIHGGAFMVGDLDMPESHMVAAELALRSNRTVVAVGYRLALDGVRHPAPLEDCYAAWRWAVENLAPDTRSRTLAGASAGASLALGCALLDRDRGVEPAATALALVYPFVHYPMPAADPALSAELAAELPSAMRFTPDFTDTVIRNYTGRLHNLPRLATPGIANLQGLPRTRITVAQYDDLRSSGQIFRSQLLDAGVEVSLRVAEGMPHGFLNRTLFLDEVGLALDDIIVAGAEF
jgi:acetyl esterase